VGKTNYLKKNTTVSPCSPFPYLNRKQIKALKKGDGFEKKNRKKHQKHAK